MSDGEKENKALDALIVAAVRGKRCEDITFEDLARDEEALSEEDLEALERVVCPHCGARYSDDEFHFCRGDDSEPLPEEKSEA